MQDNFKSIAGIIFKLLIGYRKCSALNINKCSNLMLKWQISKPTTKSKRAGASTSHCFTLHSENVLKPTYRTN